MTASTEYRPRYVAEHAEGGVVYGPPSDQRQLAERALTDHQQLTDALNALTRQWLDTASLAGYSLPGRQARAHAQQVRTLVERWGT